MSSSARLSPHRRRSHSASSPLPASRQYTTDKWRTASKRQRAGNTRNPSYKDFASDLPADKWEVDRWRRGKKARRDSSSPLPSARGPCLFGSSPVFREPWAFVPPRSHLPSTSEAFHLFPSRPRQSRSSSYHHSSSMSRAATDSPVLGTQPAPGEDVRRLRSSAFGELQRSIAESGEGLVSRMRDWEREHAGQPSHLPSQPPCGSESSPRPRASSSWADSVAEHFDDEDDIQIVSGDPCADDGSDACSRADASEGDEMDLDPPLHHSFGAQTLDGSPRYASDEDDAPPLSFSTTNSASSSQISLPHPPHPSRPTDISKSPSEKAIAALALVMANGAGGLNDYEAVRAEEGQPSSLDESLIGEMWH